MKTTFALACWLALVGDILADDHASMVRVAVLANESTLAGWIERDGDEYRVKTGAGETVLPATKVLRICNGLDDAYQYLRTRANLRDADERTRLARWCLQNNLMEKARAEAEEALRLRPGHADAKRTLKSIEAKERETPGVAVSSSASATPAAADSPPAALPKEDVLANASLALPPSASYDADTMQAFVRRVQPVLLNGCGAGNCHGNVKNGGFELIRPSTGGAVTAATSRQNLLAALALLSKDFPEQSPLLQKAMEKHGNGTRPPLGRDSAAFVALEAWVKKTLPERPREGFGAPESSPRIDSGKPSAGVPPEARPAYPGSDPEDKPSPSGLKPHIGNTAGENELHELQIKAGRFTPGSPNARPGPMNRQGPPSPVAKPAEKEPAGDRPERKTFLSPAEHRQRFLEQGESLTGPGAKPKVETPPTPADPFDPLLFNRVMHPAGKSSEEKLPPEKRGETD